jgi:uncharacterized protein (TIGR03089 family)
MLELLSGADPARPLLTFYDDGTGERIELSARTFANWVAKTANLLVDGLDAQPGDRVALALPPHWQTAVWLFAAWSAGLHVVPRGSGEDVLAVVEDDLPVEGEPAEVVGLSLNAFGMPLQTQYPGVTDYAAEVRSYGDRFPAVASGGPALTVENTTFTGPELAERARRSAGEQGLDEHSRVLTDLPPDSLRGLVDSLLAPLSVGGSAVICRNLDHGLLDRRVELEKVTVVTTADRPE